ncbi:MAG: Ig-like domain-containing protein [Myxococcales bacterium]|nr:Ig-like domain-containing protein [Myxococcales bacterium]
MNPAGPPMVRQVLVTEQITEDTTSLIKVGQLAFGEHADEFFENDDGEVNSAFVLNAQEIRIVLDELVRGSDIEEIGCADGSYSPIPRGTTPDDIADCAGPVDSLLHCDTVCLNPDTGAPIGILDEDEDGAADNMRMIDYNPAEGTDNVELAVSVICDGVNIPLDAELSFWSPSGNQTFPSNDKLSFRGLGPAIVVKPLEAYGLRTGAECGVTFRPEVVDYDDNPICAPADGNIENDCSGGDTSRIGFATTTLKVANSVPRHDDVDVSLSGSSFLLVALNAYVDPTSVGAITLTADGVDVPISPLVTDSDATAISFSLDADYHPETTYEITVAPTLADVLGGTLAAAHVVSWVTEPLALEDSIPSDGTTVADFDNIELEFNADVSLATFGAITLKKDGTPSSDGTPATDGEAVAITPTLSAVDSKIAVIADALQLDTYYEIVVSTALGDADGHFVKEDSRIAFTTTPDFKLSTSAPEDGATAVAVDGGDVLIRFNAAVNPATVAAITVTADTAGVLVTPVVQANPREVLVSVGASFDAGAAYSLTIGTGLQEVDGAAIAADIIINWTTVAP